MKKKLSALLVVLLSFVMVFSVAASAEEESSTATEPSVQIIGYSITGSSDSTGARGVQIHYNNYSGKTIKYIRFIVTPYNGVEDPVACTVTGQVQASLLVTGPIAPTTMTSSRYDDDDVKKDKDGYYICQYKIPLLNKPVWWYILFGTGNEKEKLANKQYLSDEEVLNGAWTYTSSFSAVWYNNTIARVKIDRVEVIYMDGTEETLSYEETKQNVINLREKYPYYIE
jgi:hypothetical protein